MVSATVNTNPLKDGSSKFNQSTSGKKPKAGVKAGTKAAKKSKRKSGSSSSGSQKKGAGSKSSKGGMSRSETIKLSCGPDVYYVRATLPPAPISSRSTG
ncbi:hypothetical protein PRIPAC_86429 [Pristionchus pacificus]|uniref:Uncharacterized protein n=1 Tax=Pristionchus pacificus TaxID=54126 RepID=A0A2A6BUH3_PRIPA|nr:hypothetical protein PRIPAC_86429 [Pristionchus pacificus]|eukprot:PDM69507.1 hypothetical protein PRIPAC_44603 [Pristionchus pacificus]